MIPTRVPHLCREAAEERVPEMHKGVGEVLEKEISQELAHAQVGPAAMHQQEALQVTELREGEVAGQNGLHAFLTTNPDTDVSGCRSDRTDRNCERQQGSSTCDS